MKIFKKITPTGDAQKVFVDSYKFEMKLAFSVLIVMIFGDFLVSYKSPKEFYPMMIIVIVAIQLFVFAKYLYDRRAKLLKVLDDIEADETYMISILNQSGKGTNVPTTPIQPTPPTQAEYISGRMKDFAMNITDFSVGQIVVDKFDSTESEIINMTINSIEVFIKSKSVNGVNGRQWFDMRQFNNRFKAKV